MHYTHRWAGCLYFLVFFRVSKNVLSYFNCEFNCLPPVNHKCLKDRSIGGCALCFNPIQICKAYLDFTKLPLKYSILKIGCASLLVYLCLFITHTRTHARTHTHTHTNIVFYGLRGLSIGVMVFILYKLYVLLPYTYPTPKLSPHRRLCISTFPPKKRTMYDL